MPQYGDDLNAYLAEIREYFPQIQPTSTRLLTAGGQFSTIVIVDDALIFRFPRSVHVAKELRREIPLLKALQGKLPLPIPDPIYIADDSVTGELAFMGYPMLPGQALTRDLIETIQDDFVVQQLAEELAGFLKALHSLPLELSAAEPTPSDSRAFWKRLYADFSEKLFPHMREDARHYVTQRFDEALRDDRLWEFENLLCHGDFGTGNILYSPGHISGVIDFTFCGAGDPAQDVGALLASYGHAFIERVFIAYPELRSTLPRVEFITSTYALQQALYALRDGNREDYDDGMQAYV